jgi:AraC-like DNA-binding protein
MEFARIAYEDFSFEPHFHDHYVIMLVEEGLNLGQRDKRSYEVSAGELLILQPGEVHTGSSYDKRTLSYLAFYPEASTVQHWLKEAGHGPSRLPGLRMKYRSPLLRRSFRHLFHAASTERHEPLGTDTALVDFFGTLLAAQGDRTPRPPAPAADSARYRKAVAFLHDRYGDAVTLTDLASAAETSAFHLIRLFRRHGGLTPFAYLRSLRVERAKAFLRAGESPTQVAYRTGFYDQSHFIRSFKRHTGFLPSAFSRPSRP